MWRRRSNQSDHEGTRIIFASDVHGSEVAFTKLMNAGRIYGADVVILGGDITGKVVVPVVEGPGGTFAADILGQSRVARSPEELETLCATIRKAGFYPWQTTTSGPLSADQQTEIFAELMRESTTRWMEIAERKLDGSPIRCFVQLGNDDPPELADVIREATRVEYSEDRVLHLDDAHEMLSLGYSNPTPWNSPRELPEEELEARIDELATRVQDMSNAIFNLHVPPYDSGLDTAQAVTEDLRGVVDSGNPRMIPVGSRAVRAAVERHQPLLALHGHVHDSPGAARIGRTLCLNPGSEYTESVLRAAVVDITDGEVRRHQFTAG